MVPKPRGGNRRPGRAAPWSGGIIPAIVAAEEDIGLKEPMGGLRTGLSVGARTLRRLFDQRGIMPKVQCHGRIGGRDSSGGGLIGVLRRTIPPPRRLPVPPIFVAIELIAAGCDAYLLSCSSTRRTVGSPASEDEVSGGFFCSIAPSSQESEPPTKRATAFSCRL